MMHSIRLLGHNLEMKVEHGQGHIVTHLPRELCPACKSPDCIYCEGSSESASDVAERLHINAFLEAIENLVFAHCCEGVDILDPGYIQGLRNILTKLCE